MCLIPWVWVVSSSVFVQHYRWRYMLVQYVSSLHLWSDRTPAGRWNYDPRTRFISMEAPEQCGRAVNRGGRGVLLCAINCLTASVQVSGDRGRTDRWMDGWMDRKTQARSGLKGPRYANRARRQRSSLGLWVCMGERERNSDGRWWRFIVLFLAAIYLH